MVKQCFSKDDNKEPSAETIALNALLNNELAEKNEKFINLQAELEKVLPGKAYLKEIMIDELNYQIYKENQNKIITHQEVEPPIVLCHSEIAEFISKALAHEAMLRDFSKSYYESGLSFNGLKDYDPAKTKAYSVLNEKYEQLVRSTNEIKSSCSLILKLTDETLKASKEQ